MSKAIVAARPSIESALAAGHQPTRQSRKQRRPKTDASIKALPKPRPASIIPPLGCLVSSRLSRRSHPDCRAIHHSVADRRNREDTDFALVLRYLLPPRGEWLVGA